MPERRAAAVPHGCYYALVDGAPGEPEVHPVVQRRLARQGLPLRSERGGLDEGPGKEALQALQARPKHRFPGNAHERGHLGVRIGDPVIGPDQHDRGVARIDQRLQLVPLGLHGRMLPRQGLALLRDGAEQLGIVE